MSPVPGYMDYLLKLKVSSAGKNPNRGIFPQTQSLQHRRKSRYREFAQTQSLLYQENNVKTQSLLVQGKNITPLPKIKIDPYPGCKIIAPPRFFGFEKVTGYPDCD